MERINIEILQKRVKRKDSVFIAEIQRIYGDYIVVVHQGEASSPHLVTQKINSTEDAEEAQFTMQALLNQKFRQGYKPVPNGSDIRIPGFKNAEYNQAAAVPKLEPETEHRKLVV